MASRLQKKAIEKKFRDKRERAERIVDHTDAQGYGSVSYIFENGLRKVKPYFHTYQIRASGRWIGCNILEVVKTECGRPSHEFRYNVEDHISTRLKQGLITVNGEIVKEQGLIQLYMRASVACGQQKIDPRWKSLILYLRTVKI